MRFALFALFASVLISPLPAAPISYQGQLQQNGQAVTGSAVTMEFRLFDAEAGGVQLVEPIQKSVTPQDGLFQVELDFGAGAFNGESRYLEILIVGEPQPLSPRQAITSAPQALIATTTVAGGVGASQINSSQVQQRVTGSCPAGQYVQSINEAGTVVCGAEAPSWSLGGNAGTSSATNFLGTIDNQALELRTANVRSLRIEPSAALFEGLPITANVIAGSRANEVTPGVRGATIAGGGVPSGESDPDLVLEEPNQVTDHYGTVGGGYGNRAGDGAGTTADKSFATVGGGLGNSASGQESTVGGGASNIASGDRSTVSGGRSNTASGDDSTIGGGGGFVNVGDGVLVLGPNRASGKSSVIGGGSANNASGGYSTVAGGEDNTASSLGSSVAGGEANTASGLWSTVAGGRNNTASGQDSIAAGNGNTASGVWSAVAGGNSNTASGAGSFVGSGSSNTASGQDSIVPGGQLNTASGTWSATAGGLRNCAGGRYSWAGGHRAKVRPETNPGTGSCSGLTYPGGNGDEGSFVWADSTNEDFVSQRANQFRVRANGGAEFQTGSRGLVAFSNSTSTTGAAIQGESVNADGIAIVGRNESTDATLVLNNRGTGQLIRAFTGGTELMRLENNGDLRILGLYLQLSDRHQKEDVQSVDAQMVLDRLSAIPINSWRYLRGDEGVRHIGPMAQDFHAAFGFGVSDTTISTVDAQGIAFAAIQALNQRLVDSNAEVAALKAQSAQVQELVDRNARLEQRNADMEARLVALEALLLQEGQLAKRVP